MLRTRISNNWHITKPVLYSEYYTGNQQEMVRAMWEGIIQPDWQKRLPSGSFPAPPHDATGHTWHHPDQYLFETTKYGWQRFAPPGYQSAMQGFQDVLSDAEIWAVLAFIKSHWPPSIRAQREQLNARGQ